MGIATYGSMVFSSMKQILNDVHDADVFVVFSSVIAGPTGSGKSMLARRFVHNIKRMMTPKPDRILWC
jgi:sigma54-dependent transcription regulator